MDVKDQAQGSYHHPDLRQELLDQALEILRTEGIQGLTIRRLAALAGVSHGAPYRHFASKDEIIATLMLEGHRILDRRLRMAIGNGKDSGQERMAALSRAYLAFSRDYPVHLRLMFSRSSLDSVIKIGAKAGQAMAEAGMDDLASFAPLVETVVQCQAEGSLAAGLSAHVLALSHWAHIHGLALLSSEGLIDEMATHWGMDPQGVVEGVLGLVSPGRP